MFPIFQIPGTPFLFHTGLALMILSLLSSFIIFSVFLKNEVRPLKIIGLLIPTAVVSFFGARLFHVFFERREHFQEHPEHIFDRFDGMTFYGAFIIGSIVFYFLAKQIIKNKNIESKAWDAGAIALALTYGLMRIGCFASGCCWGTITPKAWAVQYYHTASVMPYKGIPVHPVQLYDAFIGFFIFGLLIVLRQKSENLKGKLFFVFCLLYPVGRFVTEEFRGDGFRGENIFLNLSTSQLISVVLITFVIIRMIKEVNFSKLFREGELE